MSAETDPVVGELSDLVFQVTTRLSTEFNAAAANLDLPHAQALVLAKLSEPRPMRDLAEWLSCEPSNVTGIVDGLERRGLVTRQPAPTDRRVKHVILTDEGQRRRTELLSHSNAQAADLFDLPPEDRQHLRDLLVRVLKT